eukprot:COSAG02_NODE_288_length_25612_cov_29.808529_5_plen_652_part_00
MSDEPSGSLPGMTRAMCVTPDPAGGAARGWQGFSLTGRMGAGLSAQAKVRELQQLPPKEVMAYLQEAGVPKAEAKIVTKRVRAMQTVDAVAVALLVDGLSGEAQDALAAMAQGSGLPGSIAHNESLEDEIEQLLLQGWSEPPASLDDGPSLVGYTVWVAGHGKGRVTEFVRARIGASSHVIDFQNPVAGAARIRCTIKLRRKGNSEARWLVQLPTTVVVGEDDAKHAAAARDARLSLLGGRQSRSTGPVEPEPEPEQKRPARPVTPPWAQWWKANGPGNGQQRNLTQQQRLNQRRQQHEAQHGAPQMPTGRRYSNGLTAGGKQAQTGQRRRPTLTASLASSSLPPWELEPVSTGTATAAAFAEACAVKGESGAQDIPDEVENAESLDGAASTSSQDPGAQESGFSTSLQQFLDEEAPPGVPLPSREQEMTYGDQGSLPTVSSVSSDCDAVEFATFGSTPSEWTPREGGACPLANASIEEDLDQASVSSDMPGQQVHNRGLELGLSGSRSVLRMGAPGESAKFIADRARQGGRDLGQHALPKPQQGGNGATVKAGRWKKGQLLGTGSFGQVYQGLNLDTGAMLAVKVLTVPDSGRQDILEEIHQEIELMSSLSHANIVQYLGAEVDVRARELFIFQEYVPFVLNRLELHRVW